MNQLLASGRFKSSIATPPFSASQRTALPSGKETRRPESRSSMYSGALSETKGFTERPKIIPISEIVFANPTGSGNLAASKVNPYGA